MSGILEQDLTTVPGQLFALISLVGPDLPQKNDKFGLKIRGCFQTKDEAAAHAKRLQKEDGTFDIYVVDMYKWLLIPPNRDAIEDVHYQEEKLEEIMSKYRESQRAAAAMFEKRKKEMMEKPLPYGDTPFITPGDENSKFYSKPDVPPKPHPADLLEDLKAEFPDKPLSELIDMVNQRIEDDEKKRKDKIFEEAVAKANEQTLQGSEQTKSLETCTEEAEEDPKGKAVSSIE